MSGPLFAQGLRVLVGYSIVFRTPVPRSSQFPQVAVEHTCFLIRRLGTPGMASHPPCSSPELSVELLVYEHRIFLRFQVHHHSHSA
jgi:hypothetical protein